MRQYLIVQLFLAFRFKIDTVVMIVWLWLIVDF